jgi:hypothetical protein
VAVAPRTPPEADERAAHRSMIDVMREHFRKQRRVTIRVPKEAGEQFVQINGYSFQIQPGVKVEVPEAVAQVLEEAGVI